MKENGKYPDGVYSYHDDPNSYEKAGCPPLTNGSNHSSVSFDPKAITTHMKMYVEYH